MVTILVDSGSTHNFLNSKLATKMEIYPTKNGEFSVQVADGNKIKREELCENLPISVQRVQFHVSFFLLLVEGCDAVFGTQWLKRLGQIIWNSMSYGCGLGRREKRWSCLGQKGLSIKSWVIVIWGSSCRKEK